MLMAIETTSTLMKKANLRWLKLARAGGHFHTRGDFNRQERLKSIMLSWLDIRNLSHCFAEFAFAASLGAVVQGFPKFIARQSLARFDACL